MAGAKEKEPEQEGAQAAPAPAGKGSGLKRLLPILGILAGLGAAAFAVVLFVVRPLFPPVGVAEVKAAPAPAKFGRVVALEPVVVNLAQTEGRRYLKASVHLEVPEEEKTAKEVEARKPQLLDLLVTTLAKKSLAEVTAPEALDTLRGELLERMGQALGKEKVRRVFITEFVVQ
jgi:flagellar protein FliL